MQTATQPDQTPRALQGVFAPGPEHWVGDGFYVKTVFSPQLDAQMLSPFLLLDHGARRHFDPSPWRRGVGEHPHRGFETVTFAYEGEVEHRDSAGGGGRIGPGDVQWMTAASGVVHEEKHSQAFSERGGDFESQVDFFWGPAPVRDVFLQMAAHSHEHLGQMIAYARMAGVVPPWSRPRAGGP